MSVVTDLELFYSQYKGEKGIVGRSELGRNIYYFFIGNHNEKTIISTYSIHAREWITTYLALEHIKNGLNKGGAYIIPCVNPDGVDLSQNGLNDVPFEKRELLKDINKINDFSLWKSNINAVDLNVNFPAKWGQGKMNVFQPFRANYIGKTPLREAETKALSDFTLKVKPNSTISFHTKGEEIYYEFFQNENDLLRDEKIAQRLSDYTKYQKRIIKGSVGGYKDWCIEKLHIPSFTIECGNDNLTHPITLKDFNEIKKRNLNILNVLLESL